MSQARRRGENDTGAEALSEAPDGTNTSIYLEAEEETVADAVVAQRGGVTFAAGEDEDEGERPLEKQPFGVLFWICSGWIVLVIVLAILAGVLPIPDPKATGLAPPLMRFSSHHWLGTDELGRDQLARIIYGARVSMTVGFSSIFFGTLVGGALGVIAGFYRGKLEAAIMAVMDVLLSFPALVLALGLITFLGQNLRNVVLAISILSIAPIARLIRSATLAVTQREFVLAARMLGAKNRRIILRDVIPVVSLPVVSFALIGVAVAVVAEGALAFLGLSVPAPTPTWGGMITDGRVVLAQDPWIAFIPSIVLFITVLALNFAGDTLRTHFDVREGAL